MIGKYTEGPEGRRLGARIELWECEGFFVILHGESHIQYSNQTGGTRCAHPVVEGYLIPMNRYCNPDTGEDIFEGLREITLDWWGAGMLEWLKTRKGEIGRLKKLVEALRPTGWEWKNGLWCELDMHRLETEKCGESWLPVNTPMGPGWLTWENSD